MRTRVTAGVVLAVTTVLSACFMRGPVVVMSADDGQLDACWRVSSGEVVVLVFTNSMYGGEVREFFRVEGGALVRIAFETENAAAAEYYAYNRAVEPGAGGYRVELPAEVFDAVPVRIDARGDYRVRIGGDEVSLSEGVEGSTGAVLRMEERSLIERMTCR